jgi:hypothetical protein
MIGLILMSSTLQPVRWLNHFNLAQLLHYE